MCFQAVFGKINYLISLFLWQVFPLHIPIMWAGYRVNSSFYTYKMMMYAQLYLRVTVGMSHYLKLQLQCCFTQFWWRDRGISRSNLSCLPAGAFAPPALRERWRRVYFTDFEVGFRCSYVWSKGSCWGTKPLFTEPRCWTCGRLGSWLTKREYRPTTLSFFGVTRVRSFTCLKRHVPKTLTSRHSDKLAKLPECS